MNPQPKGGLVKVSWDCLMIVGWTLFISYTHAQKHICVFILFRHAHKPNFLPQLKCSRLRNKNLQSDCSNVCGTVSSDTVHSCADDFWWGTAPQWGTLLSSKFPSSSKQGKLEDKEIFGFQLNFPWKFRRQKRMNRKGGKYVIKRPFGL
jgi:hypothetical protein